VTPSFDITSANYSLQFRTLLAKLGAEAKDLVTQQMRLLLEKILQFTPPKSRVQGVTATRKQISLAVRSFNVSEFKSPRLAEIVRTKNYRAFEAFMQNVSNDALRYARAAPFSPELHERVRDNRGRVRSNKKIFVIGRADRNALKSYIKAKVDNVGIAASGWLAALHKLGGKEASWIERHGERHGAVIDERNSPDMPNVTAINTTPWASRQDEGQRIIRAAKASRTSAMRTYLQKALERSAKAAGLN
jgi:hypothetical protein